MTYPLSIRSIPFLRHPSVFPIDYRTSRSGSIPERRMAQFLTVASTCWRCRDRLRSLVLITLPCDVKTAFPIISFTLGEFTHIIALSLHLTFCPMDRNCTKVSFVQRKLAIYPIRLCYPFLSEKLVSVRLLLSVLTYIFLRATIAVILSTRNPRTNSKEP